MRPSEAYRFVSTRRSYQQHRGAANDRNGSKADSCLSRRQRLRDQLPTILDTIEGDEAAHAGALAGAEQRLVERLEPVAQAFELVALADFEHDILNRVAGGVGRQPGQFGIQVLERFDLIPLRRAAL